MLAKQYENLAKLRIDELLNEDMYYLKHFSQYCLQKKVFFIFIFISSYFYAKKSKIIKTFLRKFYKKFSETNFSETVNFFDKILKT